ncbi:MAG: CDP-glycerol glycerophosphotransferase family protein [Clostridiaceae bacterium]
MIKNIFKKMLYFFIPTKKNQVSILDETSFSGSNSYAVYRYIIENEKKEVLDNINLRIFNNQNRPKRRQDRVRDLYYKISSDIIISTHSITRYKKKQILVQLWHGIPLKSMGLLDESYCEQWIKNDKTIFDNIDIIVSPSKFYNALLNATIGQSANKYTILGYPRNDYFLKKNNIDLKIFFKKINLENKLVFFIPTFKKGYGDRVEGNSKTDNFFGIENFEMIKFSEFLVENKINFVLKLHPFEEEYYKEKLSELNLSNIYFLSSNTLISEKIDLYELLSKSDMLVTDYSSVYFDYLLTEKPMLFVNPDEEEYRRTRGFLLEPYSFWTPGPKVKKQEMLQSEMVKLFNDNDYYKRERKEMLNIFHKNFDANSSERVWKYIKNQYLKL